MQSLNSFNTQKKIIIDKTEYKYFDLKTLSKIYNFELERIPNSIKIIIENLLRNEER
jgi:Aconitase A